MLDELQIGMAPLRGLGKKQKQKSTTFSWPFLLSYKQTANLEKLFDI